MDGEFNTVIVNAHTPIDENNLELRMGQSGYFQDVAIWEHKRWQDEPMLCDGDGPIGDLRRWYARFYEAPSHWRIDE